MWLNSLLEAGKAEGRGTPSGGTVRMDMEAFPDDRADFEDKVGTEEAGEVDRDYWSSEDWKSPQRLV